MLVRPFQIKIGREGTFGGMRAAQHGLVRGARVEPHVERVTVFNVRIGIIPEQLARIEVLPCLDTAPFDPLRDLFEQLERARMQLAGFLVHEERHRYAPLALP